MPKKLTIEEMYEIALTREGKCLSKEYLNARSNLEWECRNGHQWLSTADRIKKGAWCPVCGGSYPLTIAEMHGIAEGRGGKCLSENYINEGVKLEWECAEGHRWFAAPDKIKQGHWCHDCGGSKPLTLDQMNTAAEARGGKCLSKKYINARTKLRWVCALGHKWQAVPSSILSGTWCPYCAGKKKTIHDMQVMAKKQKGTCLSSEYINAKTKLEWECRNNHRWWATPDGIKSGRWCSVCAIEKRKSTRKKKSSKAYLLYQHNELELIAQQFGGVCLGDKLAYGHNDVVSWSCRSGHVFSEKLSKVIQDKKWCPTCSV